MLKKYFVTAFSIIIFPTVAAAQSGYSCTGPGLSELMVGGYKHFTKSDLKPAFMRNNSGFEIAAYHDGDDLKVITVSYVDQSEREDIEIYFQTIDDHLMYYHKQQNSDYYGERDSVLLKEEKSYFHVCDGRMLAPAQGGVIDNELYDKMVVLRDAVLTELHSIR